jgi:hypothetical protein
MTLLKADAYSENYFRGYFASVPKNEMYITFKRLVGSICYAPDATDGFIAQSLKNLVKALSEGEKA